MSGSAKGTLEKPGKNVAAKAGLNKAILDQGWFEFQRQLTYKEQWMGGQVILINPVNTSRTCSVCNHVARESRKSQEIFECVSCGHRDNADVKAARNIFAAGRAVLACGDTRRVAVYSPGISCPLGQRGRQVQVAIHRGTLAIMQEMTFFLFDVDGVIVNPLAYRAGVTKTLELLCQRIGLSSIDDLLPTEAEISRLESVGVHDVWDMTNIIFASVLTSIAQSKESAKIALPEISVEGSWNISLQKNQSHQSHP